MRIERVGVRLVPAAGRAGDPSVPPALVEAAREAERRGLDVVAVPERLDAEGGVPAALVVCAAIAAATGRIAIATAVLPLSHHHPLRVAEDAALVDGLSGGRLELGIGLGADREEAAGFGLDPDARAARFDEAVALMRQAWAEAPVAHAGTYFAVEGVEVHPRPWRPEGPPLWVGASAPAAQRRAARLGVGLALEAGREPGPYLETCRALGVHGRLALLGPLAAVRAALAPELTCEVWVDVDPLRPELEPVVELLRARAG